MTASSVQSRHVLVIGGAGYVGSVMVRDFLSRGYRVRVLDNFLYDHAHAVEGLEGQPGYSFVFGDFCNLETLERCLEGISDVVLLASLVGDPVSKKYPGLTRSVNLTGSRTVFDALQGKGIERFVFTSTCSNYGLRETDSLAQETDALHPLSLYAETKVDFENYILSRRDSVDFSPVILRIATAFGCSPRMRFDLTVNEFTATLASGQRLDVYDRETWRPYCHILDITGAVACVLEAGTRQVRGEVFNVGADENNYTKQMIVDGVLQYLDGEVRYVEQGSDPRNYRVSFAKIRNNLGFVPRHSVRSFIPELIHAIHDGQYPHRCERPDFYGNHTVRPDIAA